MNLGQFGARAGRRGAILGDDDDYQMSDDDFQIGPARGAGRPAGSAEADGDDDDFQVGPAVGAGRSGGRRGRGARRLFPRFTRVALVFLALDNSHDDVFAGGVQQLRSDELVFPAGFLGLVGVLVGRICWGCYWGLIEI